MKTKKLSLNDFNEVELSELLQLKGGARPHVFHSRHVLQEGDGGGGGGHEPAGPCFQSPNGFGGYNDQSEVVVTANYTGPCLACDFNVEQGDEGTFVTAGLLVAHQMGLHSPRPYTSPCTE